MTLDQFKKMYSAKWVTLDDKEMKTLCVFTSQGTTYAAGFVHVTRELKVFRYDEEKGSVPVELPPYQVPGSPFEMY